MNKPLQDEVTDEQIQAAFKNTNFGTTDYKSVLLKGAESVALSFGNGWTLTTILRDMGLAVATDNEYGNKLTAKGLNFIKQSALSQRTEQAKERDGWISVDDRLPEDSTFVDVWIKSTANHEYGARHCDVLFVEDRTPQFRGCLPYPAQYVSHWMPFPQAPMAEPSAPAPDTSNEI